MARRLQHPDSAGIELADGSRLRLIAEDANARRALAEIARLMELGRAATNARTLTLVTGSQGQRLLLKVSAEEAGTRAELKPTCHRAELVLQLQLLASVIAGEPEARGGVLVHGALAEHEGRGVILAGPGGAGKTTAIHRLPPTWTSWCDDTTLVVRDPSGGYRAHPWPTWGQLLRGASAATWDSQRSLPVAGIFFLVQDEVDRVQPLAPAPAVCLLTEAVEQASRAETRGMDSGRERVIRLRRFESSTSLAGSVRCHLLHLCPSGSFWNEIESVLTGCSRSTGVTERRRSGMRIPA